jgi:hypothetical protein
MTVKTVMWEAVAAPSRVEDLLDWVRDRIPEQAQLFRGAGDRQRVVVIDPTAQAAELLTDPPAELIDRPPHSWEFEPA